MLAENICITNLFHQEVWNGVILNTKLIRVDYMNEESVFMKSFITGKVFKSIPDSPEEIRTARPVEFESIPVVVPLDKLIPISITPSIAVGLGFDWEAEWECSILEKDSFLFCYIEDLVNGTNHYISVRHIDEGAIIMRRIYYLHDFQNVYKAIFDVKLEVPLSCVMTINN